MPIVHDDAIVLRLADFSETSQVATLFAADGGQLRLIAKGIRRGTRTRVAPGLDLLEWGTVSYAPAHGEASLATLTEWTQRDAFSGLRRTLVSLYAGLYAAELVAALTEPGDPHPELFEALRALLSELNEDAAAGPRIGAFQYALAQSIGYAPVLERCVECGHVPTARPAPHFSAAAGGVLCRDCEMHHAEKRRMPAAIVGRVPGEGDAYAWFELLDYHFRYLAGKAFKTSAPLAAALRAAAR
jgi:DNA repair protein RecO (recombination protein O)